MGSVVTAGPAALLRAMHVRTALWTILHTVGVLLLHCGNKLETEFIVDCDVPIKVCKVTMFLAVPCFSMVASFSHGFCLLLGIALQ